MSERAPDGWGEYAKLVLSRLDDLKAGVAGLDDKLDKRIAELDARVSSVVDTFYKEIAELKVKVAMLEVKSGVFGAVGGLLTVGIFIAYEILKGQ